MKFRLLIMHGIVSLLFLACKKETQEIKQTPSVSSTVTPPPPTYKFYPVPNELKDYGFFKVGSYWIYRIDSASTLTDSVYVKSISTSTFSIWKDEDSIVVGERIRIYFGYNPNFNDRFYSSFILSSHPYQNISAPNYINQISFTIFELDSLNIPPLLGDGMVENKSISNYVLNGVNYGNCRRLKYTFKYYTPSGPEHWYSNECYWKKNVGLVKNDNTFSYNICSLLRYSVIQ